jgi:hypothetical protein
MHAGFNDIINDIITTLLKPQHMRNMATNWPAPPDKGPHRKQTTSQWPNHKHAT